MWFLSSLSKIAKPPDIPVSCLQPSEPAAWEVHDDDLDDEPKVDVRQVEVNIRRRLDARQMKVDGQKLTDRRRDDDHDLDYVQMCYEKKERDPAECDQEPRDRRREEWAFKQ